jgi:carboxypeptidase family protein
MRFLKNLICVLILSFTSLNVAAQQITGSIRGSISDPSGAVVQEATVTAKQLETGLIRTVSSAKEGGFLLVELPVGHYSLEVAARGFQKYVQEGISLNVNEAAAVPVRLTVSAETQRVEVQADANLIQTTTSSLGLAVTEHELLDLPLDGRDFSQLGLLQPGAAPLTPGLKEAAGSLRDGQAYAVDGSGRSRTIS